jgi:chemotaxis protein methyltransferase CheR
MHKMGKNLNDIIETLLLTKGIDVSRFDETFLSKSLQKRMTENSCSSTEDYYALLDEDSRECDEFLHSLQISYSEFFRNPLTFSVLEKIILPSLVQKKAACKRKEIRIWSAACAGGQETYSISMLLNEFMAGNSANLDFRIFSTDISEDKINEAQKGQYPAMAMNMLTLGRVKQWFTSKGDVYFVKPQLKEHVEFSVFDLLNPEFCCPPTSIFGDFDIVFCANLLFYFKPEYRTKILEKMSHSLAKGGFLITGETEREILINNKYQEVYSQSAIFIK